MCVPKDLGLRVTRMESLIQGCITELNPVAERTFGYRGPCRGWTHPLDIQILPLDRRGNEDAC
jgi:hypothetical protein